MRLPFTETEFLEIFAAYNSALWPAVVALWIATFGFSIALVRGRARPVALSALAAVHWAWSGVAYHAVFFTRINPAAWLFAFLFLAQALAFVWIGIARRRLRFDWGRPLCTTRHVLAGVFLVYSLLYPALVLLSGHDLPRAPAFAVPCPTTLFTAGLLFAVVPPVPRRLFVIPVVWSLIGGSSALSLGVTPDLIAIRCCNLPAGLRCSAASLWRVTAEGRKFGAGAELRCFHLAEGASGTAAEAVSGLARLRFIPLTFALRTPEWRRIGRRLAPFER